MSDYNTIRGGTGLKLIGYPTDEKKFFWIVAQEGCHPQAAQRILDRIKLGGYDLLTVMSQLNFDWIIKELSHVGVTVTFIEAQKDWVNKFQDGDWPEEALPERFRRK